MPPRRLFLWLLGVAAAALFTTVVALANAGPPSAGEYAPLPQETEPPVQKSIGDDTCLDCHSKPGLTMELENGQLLYLYVNPEQHFNSIHGQKGYACVQCHTRVGNYPHPPFTATDRRDVTLKLYVACQRCHPSQYALTQDSVHAIARTGGNRQAAVCTDCHTAHQVRQLTDPETGDILPEARTWIPTTCAQCHDAIYEKYRDSVHGSALVGEGNPDVPTCIDCHGVHNIENPTTAAFRLKSPQICAKCHTDPQIMDKYGIPTNVLRTYIADFHGTTVTLFRKEHPDQETNKPVCYDCHGVHDIVPPNDPKEGLQVKSNLLETCRQCHPNATTNFPDAWLSHYIPSPQKTPLVYAVNLFYQILIPGVLGGMAILVAMDARWQLRQKINAYRRKRRSMPKEPPSTPERQAGSHPQGTAPQNEEDRSHD
jgi:hypothetical protein